MKSGDQFWIINTKFSFLKDQKEVKVTLCLSVFVNGETLTRFSCM